MGLDATQIILRPLLSEKSNWESEEPRNRYSFAVVKSANKYQIAKAIEELFNVKVVKVYTQIRKGEVKRTRFGYRETPTWKKAVVKLADEDRIDLF